MNLGQSLCMGYRLSPDLVSHISSEKKKALIQWLKVVEDYCSRTATFPSDKLLAIAALAKEFPVTLGSGYHAGLRHYGFFWQM